MGSREDQTRFERTAQLFLGAALWIGMLVYDIGAGVELAELSSQQMITMAIRYGFAAILIKGVTVAEIADLVRAWRGKP